eukprot:m.309295 g.309295  ORF g.309295 m.309295 type:complete len:176 (+) comp46011_c0_seq1:74-601(+)
MAIGTDEHRSEAPLRLALRIIAMVFGAAIIGLIQGYLHDDFLGTGENVCAFNAKDSACSLSTATAGLAIVLAIIFIIVDIMDVMGKFENSKGALAAFALDGVLSFFLIVLWLAAAIYSDEQWRTRPNMSSNFKKDLVEKFEAACRSGDAVIVFSFLSFPIWLVLSCFSFKASAYF